jgi:FMN phosphatase YigB (HAD superfamily)
VSVRAAVFDQHGVLCRLDSQAVKEFFRPLLPISLSELSVRIERWGGDQAGRANLLSAAVWETFWRELCVELGLPERHVEQLLGFRYQNYCCAYPDALEGLALAKRRGLRIGVLSNMPFATLEGSLESLGFGGLLDAVVVPQISSESKPAPGAYLMAAQRLGVMAGECLFFDDESENVAGARAVGMEAYLVDRSRAAGSDRSGHALNERVVCDLSALVDILAADRG